MLIVRVVIPIVFDPLVVKKWPNQGLVSFQWPIDQRDYNILQLALLFMNARVEDPPHNRDMDPRQQRALFTAGQTNIFAARLGL